MLRNVSLSSLLLLCIAFSLTGCTTLDPSRMTGMFGTAAKEPPPPQPSGPTIVVEFHSPESSKVEVKKLPLTDGMTIQDAVDQLRAGKHFRRCHIDLMRTAPQSTEPHKMEIAWDNGKHRVAFSTNYALYPNDRIMIIEDTETVLDDMVNTLMGNKKKR